MTQETTNSIGGSMDTESVAAAIPDPDDSEVAGERTDASLTPRGSDVEPSAAPTVRYHGLDALRGFAMMLGIVLHAALSYFLADVNTDYAEIWPQDDQQSIWAWVVYEFIHSWRMPTFFLLAGFFAHLVLDRRGDGYFAVDRLKRILLPLIAFGVIIAVTMPTIWESALKREFSFVNPLEITPSDWSIAHLWFIYHLVYLYVILMVARWIACRLPWQLPLGRVLLAAFVNQLYFPLVILFSVIAIGRFVENVEDYLLWPIGAWDFMYSLVPFLLGYGLYKRRELVKKLTSTESIILLLVIATLAFAAQLMLTLVVAASDEAAEVWGLPLTFAVATATVCYTFGLIGLFQVAFATHNTRIRWVADSSYWVYIMHLPVVLIVTALMFEWPLPAELKFLIACALTGALGFATYRAFVRYTPIGTLLNGKRVRGFVGRPPPSQSGSTEAFTQAS